MRSTMKPGEPAERPAARSRVEEQLEALERSRARASTVAKICLAASFVIGVGFVFDLATMPEGCGDPAVYPGWFVVGMIGLALAGTIAAGSARSRARALRADTARATDLLWSGVGLLFVTVLGSVIGVVAAGLHGAFGCM